MKFLFFTDTHIKGTSPKNRTDDFTNTLKQKFNEIKDICEKEKVDYVLHGGDWFDRPDLSPSIVREFAIILKQFNIPIYTVAGNHDVFGHNPNTLGRTMLGLIEGIGIMKVIKSNESIFLTKNNKKVEIKGSSYAYDIDGDKHQDYYVVKKSHGSDFLINIVHGMLLKKPFYEGINYTLIENIVDTQADITLAGHYHSGFGIEKNESKYFVNPGSLVRINNSLSEIKRKPKIVIIELGEKIEIKEVDLKSAKPGDEVLDRKELIVSSDRNLKINEFYNLLSGKGGYEKIDINTIIGEIAGDKNIKSEVKKECIRRIGIAREKLSTSDNY